MTEFTAKDKWEAAKREVKQRQHVYPRLIAAGKITDGFAAAQIAVMEAIAKDYEAAAEAIIHAERTRQGTLL
jgi:hypothetical protein